MKWTQIIISFDMTHKTIRLTHFIKPKTLFSLNQTLIHRNYSGFDSPLRNRDDGVT